MPPLPLLLLALILLPALGAQSRFLPGYRHLRGTLGPYPITMDVLNGAVFFSYDRIGHPISLQVLYAGKEPYRLCEAYYEAEQNCLAGRQTADGVFRGTWMNSATGKALPVLLRPAAAPHLAMAKLRTGPSAPSTDRILVATSGPLQVALDRDHNELCVDPDPHRQLSCVPQIAWNSARLLSLAVSIQSYYDGTKDFIGVAYQTYDVVRGRRLRLDDIFRPDSDNELNRLIRLDYLRQFGPEDEHSFQTTPNFLLTSQGILFGWDQEHYQAEGHFEVFLPFTALEALLRPEVSRWREPPKK
ncbi:MAG: hypothetical protein K2X03_07790 [Bryobacteraceae bacterium]|nr:hypothetical protein [Bryobacteraceae bacterium]